MSPDLQRAQLVVLRLILIILVGAAGTFGAVKLRDHNRHDSRHAATCNDARVAYANGAGDGTPPPPAGC